MEVLNVSYKRCVDLNEGSTWVQNISGEKEKNAIKIVKNCRIKSSKHLAFAVHAIKENQQNRKTDEINASNRKTAQVFT